MSIERCGVKTSTEETYFGAEYCMRKKGHTGDHSKLTCESRRKNRDGSEGCRCRLKIGHSGKHTYYTPFNFRVWWTDDEAFKERY